MASVLGSPLERFSKDRSVDTPVTTEAARFLVVENGEPVTFPELITSELTTTAVPSTQPESTTSTIVLNTTVMTSSLYNVIYNNTTSEYNYTTRETVTQTPYEVPFSEGGIIFSAVMLIPMAVFGLIANLFTMIVIAKSKTLKSLFNHLLISLCLSDMLSALFSPLPLYRQTWGFEEWLLTEPLCKCSFAVDALTTYVTTIHILLFATFRLISIKWPITFKKITILQIRIIIVCVWVLGFTCAFVPYWIMFKDVVRDRYSNGPDANWSHCSLNPAWVNEFITYYKISYPIFIYFPMASIIILCPTIGITIKQRRFKSSSASSEDKESETRLRKKERNAILQLAFITGSFLMGYIPNTAHVVYTTNVVPENMAMRVLEWNLYMLGYIFLRFSECLNPIFYNLASSKMRKETKAFLKLVCGCVKCFDSTCATTTSPSASSGSSNAVGTTNVVL